MAAARINAGTSQCKFTKVTYADGTVVAKIEKGGVLVATSLTLDQLTALMENEPAAGSKTRSITVERIANIEQIVADASLIIDVSDDSKKDGTVYPLATTLSAYRKIVAERKLADVVNVTEYKAAGKVILTGNPVTEVTETTEETT